MDYDAYFIGDIHGSFDTLQTLLTKITKVSQFDEELNEWTWTSRDTIVVLLGDFLDFFRPPNATVKITTEKAIQNQIKILAAITQLGKQANSSNNSRFICLMGNHDIAALLRLQEYQSFQMASPNDQYLQDWFVEKHLWPFASQCGIAVQFGSYVCVHGGWELNWLNRHFGNKEDLIPQINKMFREAVTLQDLQRLRTLLEPDSPLCSRVMAYHPDQWRFADKTMIKEKLCKTTLIPKFVIAHTTVQDIANNQFLPPLAQCAKKGSILASRDYDGEDDIYYVDVGMSPNFIDKSASLEERQTHLPQCLHVRLHVNEANPGLEYFSECEVLVQKEKRGSLL